MEESEQGQRSPEVSVLIVSEDNARALRRCLTALEASAERETFEILVVDNGSHDESPHLDNEFPNVTFLRLPRRFGFVKALNIGMRTAKGEFFFFLAPEAEVGPDTVARLRKRLAEESGVVAVCPLLVDAEGRRQPQCYRLPEPSSILRLAHRQRFEPAEIAGLDDREIPVAFPSLAALMIRSYFLKGLRYIDERYGQHWADAEIAVQVRRASRSILLLPQVRVLLHPAELPDLRLEPRVRALYAADWALGAATFAGKHYGFAAGVKVRVALVAASLLAALASLLRLRDVSYHFRRAAFLLSGQKLNGTQAFL